MNFFPAFKAAEPFELQFQGLDLIFDFCVRLPSPSPKFLANAQMKYRKKEFFNPICFFNLYIGTYARFLTETVEVLV